MFLRGRKLDTIYISYSSVLEVTSIIINGCKHYIAVVIAKILKEMFKEVFKL